MISTHAEPLANRGLAKQYLQFTILFLLEYVKYSIGQADNILKKTRLSNRVFFWMFDFVTKERI